MKRIAPRLGALLLGALTLVVTPLVMVVLGGLVLLLRSPAGAPVVLIAKALHLEGLPGYFGAMMVLAALLWLAGNLLAALVSWRIYHSRNLAVVTFVAGFGFQIVGAAVSYTTSTWNEGRDMDRMDAAFADVRQQITSYAELGPPEASVSGRQDHWGDDHPEFGPYYEFLEVSVPVTVHRPGTYQFEVHYEAMRQSAYRFLCDAETTRTLPAGADTLRIAFRPGMYRSPTFTGGLAWVKTRYVLSNQQYLDLAKPTMHVPGGRIRELEQTWRSFGMASTREEYVDSAGTAYLNPPQRPRR